MSALGFAAAFGGILVLLWASVRMEDANRERVRRRRDAEDAEVRAAARHRAEMAHARERLAAQQAEVDAAFARFQRQRIRLARRSAARLRPAQRRMLLRP